MRAWRSLVHFQFLPQITQPLNCPQSQQLGTLSTPEGKIPGKETFLMMLHEPSSSSLRATREGFGAIPWDMGHLSGLDAWNRNVRHSKCGFFQSVASINPCTTPAELDLIPSQAETTHFGSRALKHLIAMNNGAMID